MTSPKSPIAKDININKHAGKRRNVDNSGSKANSTCYSFDNGALLIVDSVSMATIIVATANAEQ